MVMPSPDQSHESGRFAIERDPRLRLIIPAVVAVAFLMEQLDSTAIVTAVPDMARSLATTPLRMNLAVTTYILTLAIMIILVPILLPVLATFNIDLTHFGIVLLVNLVIGQITPPVGVLLFVSGSISKTPLGPLVKEVWPYVVVLIGVLMLLTYGPALSLWLPAALK